MNVLHFLYHLLVRHEGMASLLAIAFILHLPAPADLPRLEAFAWSSLVRWVGQWARCVYGWARDSLQAYVNRPAAKKD